MNVDQHTYKALYISKLNNKQNHTVTLPNWFKMICDIYKNVVHIYSSDPDN